MSIETGNSLSLDNQIFVIKDGFVIFSTIESAEVLNIDKPVNCSKLQFFKFKLTPEEEKEVGSRTSFIADILLTSEEVIESFLSGKQFEINDPIIKPVLSNVRDLDKDKKAHLALTAVFYLGDALTQHEKNKLSMDSKIKIDFFKNNPIPPIPEDLEIDQESWEMMLAGLILGFHLLILGPKGAGKTILAKNLAQSIGYNFHRFNFGAAHKAKSFFCGSLQAKEGSTVLVESEFLKAFSSSEKSIIFADEITRTPTQAANYALTIFEDENSYIYIEELGKKIYKGSGVSFIAAGNVGGQYTDTRTQDGAFWDRFQKFTVNYLDPDKELRLLKRRTNCSSQLLTQLIKDCNNLRAAEKEGELTTAISTRQAIAGGKLLAAGFTYEQVWGKMLINNFINGNNDEIEIAKTILTLK